MKKFLFIFLILICAKANAQVVDTGKIYQAQMNIDHELRLLDLEHTITAATGTVSFTIIQPAVDDTVIVGNGTTFEAKTIPDCPSGILQYTQATNTLSCGSASVYGWEYVEGGSFSSQTTITITETFSSEYVYHLLIEGQVWSSVQQTNSNIDLTINSGALTDSILFSRVVIDGTTIADDTTTGSLGVDYTLPAPGSYNDFLIDFIIKYRNTTIIRGNVVGIISSKLTVNEFLGYLSSQGTSLTFTLSSGVGPLWSGRWFLYRTKQ